MSVSHSHLIDLFAKFWNLLCNLAILSSAVSCYHTSVLLCRLRSIATHRDHFVRRLSVRLSVRPSVTLP